METLIDGGFERRSTERTEQSRMLDKGKLAGCSWVRDQTTIFFKCLLCSNYEHVVNLLSMNAKL